MGEVPLFIEDEPRIEFIDCGDLVKIIGPNGDGTYTRVMPRSVHYAYVKKCVAMHERFMRERSLSEVVPLRRG